MQIKFHSMYKKLKIKSCGKRLYPTESVTYLAGKTDANPSWQYHVNDLFPKINRSNDLPLKMSKYASLKISILHLFYYF